MKKTNEDAQAAFNKINPNQQLPGSTEPIPVNDSLRAYIEADIAMTNALYAQMKINEVKNRISKLTKTP